MSQQTIETALLKILHEVKEIKKLIQPTELDVLQKKLKELENRVEILENYKIITQPLQPFPSPYNPYQPPVIWCNHTVIWCNHNEGTTPSPKFPMNEVVGKVENVSTELK